MHPSRGSARQDPGRRGRAAWIALLAGAFAVWAAGAQASSDACLRCHGMATLARRAVTGEVRSLAVDRHAFARSEHGKLGCVACHGRAYETFPHPTAAAKRLECPTCHSTHESELERASFAAISGEFNKSVHAQRHGGGFTCFACHDPHSFRRWGEVSRRSVAEQNGVCLKCHASEARFAQVAARPLPDLDRAHAWLPHAELHRRQVRCLDCHSSYEPPVKSHLILPAKEAVRDCVACHSATSALKVKLYRHQREEETARLGFANAIIVNDAYVIGATRNRWVDGIGALLLLGTLLGAGTHGALRLRANRRQSRGR